MQFKSARPSGAFFIGIVLIFAGIATAAKTSTTKSAATEPAPNVVPVFRLTGVLREAPPQFNWGFETDQLNLYELLSRLDKAKLDAKVKAVVLLFDNPQFGWAQRQEIRQAVRNLRAAEKDVFCVLEDAEQADYLMSTSASRIYLSPTGTVNLIGMHVEETYLKGLLDKIHVQADIEHMGAYKGAGEPFTRTAPSDEAKEMLNWLLKDLFDQMVEQVAEDRHLQPDQVRALIDRGPFNAKEAKQDKLIDEIAYADEFIDSLKERYGDNVKLVHDYGQRKTPQVDLSSPFAMFKLFGEMMSKSKTGGKTRIAVVYVDGMIVSGKTEDNLFGDGGIVGSTTMRRLLAKVQNDDQIKAIVLRVNSPGGSALASDIIWHATEVLHEDKPFIVSMGDMAASGGYYVSVGSSTIFADPGTLTGSIGVIGGKMVTQGMWNWLGITFHETTLGKHADLYNTNRPFDEQQRELVRKYMKEVYGEFKDRVTDGRKKKIKGDIESLAGGRVYTGRQAKAKGLVDQMGGLQDAIKFAADKAKVSNYDVVQYPEPKNFLEALFKGMSGEEDNESDTVQVATHYGWLLKVPPVAELTSALARLDPAKARAVLGMLFRLELLSRENVLLITPSVMTIR